MDKLLIKSRIVGDDLASFQWNFELNVENKNYLNSLEHIDDSLHPSTYKPYELFLENVFLNLQKKQIML